MGRADTEDIKQLMEDILDCWKSNPDGSLNRDELFNTLSLALEAEYEVGFSDGYTDGLNDEARFQLGG